jgi:hypothetical protein
MSHKKAELYRGFNIFTEETRPGVWSFVLSEVPATDAPEQPRPPARRRVPGEHPSSEAALAAARAHIDRIQQNRKNRSNQGAG